MIEPAEAKRAVRGREWEMEAMEDVGWSTVWERKKERERKAMGRE